MSRHLLLSCGLLLSAGCVGVGASVGHQIQEPAVAAQACKAGPVQFALGETLSSELKDAVLTRSGATRVRVLRAEDVVTLEFDGGRLNLHVDKDDMVTDARCG